MDTIIMILIYIRVLSCIKYHFANKQMLAGAGYSVFLFVSMALLVCRWLYL